VNDDYQLCLGILPNFITLWSNNLSHTDSHFHKAAGKSYVELATWLWRWLWLTNASDTPQKLMPRMSTVLNRATEMLNYYKARMHVSRCGAPFVVMSSVQIGVYSDRCVWHPMRSQLYIITGSKCFLSPPPVPFPPAQLVGRYRGKKHARTHTHTRCEAMSSTSSSLSSSFKLK